MKKDFFIVEFNARNFKPKIILLFAWGKAFIIKYL